MIRVASVKDAEQILKIYAPYVEKTAITFEYEVPALTEFRKRIENTLKKYPYIVVEKENEILGYAYAGPFVGRAAFDWSVEVTVYVREDQKKTGLREKVIFGIGTTFERAGDYKSVCLYCCAGSGR